ncbi:hypothetical protein RSAG8_05998, partial [Rhizoctonia solani AG-8 WAC10335]
MTTIALPTCLRYEDGSGAQLDPGVTLQEQGDKRKVVNLAVEPESLKIAGWG